MDRENEIRRKELESFREENRSMEERIREENRKREEGMENKLEALQKQVDEMKEELMKRKAEDLQKRRQDEERFKTIEAIRQGAAQSDEDGAMASNKGEVELECMERMRGIEMWMDRKEREEKANNLIISGWNKEGQIKKRDVAELLITKLGFYGK